MSGKGSNRRPTQISDQEAEANWHRIFGSNKFNHLLKDDKDGFNQENNMFGKPMKKGSKGNGNGKGKKPKC